MRQWNIGATFLLLGVTTIYTIATASGQDNLISLSGTCYNLTYLLPLEADFRHKIIIKEAASVWSEDLFYYSFEPNITDQEYYKVGFVHLTNNSQHGVLASNNKVFNFGTLDVDQAKKIVFLGGSDGIYKLDIKAQNLVRLSNLGDNIIVLRNYDERLMFVRDDEHQIYTKINLGQTHYPKTIPKAVKNFVVTKHNEIIYLNTTGLFACKGEKVTFLSKNNYLRGLTTDLKGDAYAWWIDGIYKVVIERDFEESKLVKVAHLPNIGAMVFTKDNNILLTLGRGLFKMTVTSEVEC